MTDEPIACSLTATATAGRLREWQELLAADVDTVEADGASARLLLRGGDGPLVRAVDLAEREKQCCSFFEFGVTLDGRRRWLTVDAPGAAEVALRTLLGHDLGERAAPC